MKIFRSSYIILYDAVTLIHMPQFVKPVFGYIYFCICSILYREQLIKSKYKQNYLTCCVFRTKTDMTEWKLILRDRERVLWHWVNGTFFWTWKHVVKSHTGVLFCCVLLNREEIHITILFRFACVNHSKTWLRVICLWVSFWLLLSSTPPSLSSLSFPLIFPVSLDYRLDFAHLWELWMTLLFRNKGKIMMHCQQK